jgi:hypothetical protein
MIVQEHYRGFVFTWQNPPETGEGYKISISSEDLDLNGKLEAEEQVRPARHVLKEAQREAQQFIDSLLSPSQHGQL